MEAARKNRWTVPVGAEIVAEAKRGKWSVLLTPTKPVPSSWFPPLGGVEALCLASGGGQQGPLLAAAGARVTVLDNSEAQLAGDRLVAERDSLDIKTVHGDMADLSMFPDCSFDLIFNPCSNCFVPDVRVVWREAYRVLRPGGTLLSGFTNGMLYLFDEKAMRRGIFKLTHSLPYSDLKDLSESALRELVKAQRPLEFGHTMSDQIGGQLDAGLLLCGFYEDVDPAEPLARHMPMFAATRALKPAKEEG